MGRHVVLVGPMAVGKTTLGRALARAIDRPFLDSDVELEGDHDMTGAEIARRDGVERLHEIEFETFVEMMESTSSSVIAPAASVIDTEEGRDLLKCGLTIWLDAPGDVLDARRVSGDHRRAIPREEIDELERRRSPWWEEVASFRFHTSRPVPALVDDLAARVRRLESA